MKRTLKILSAVGALLLGSLGITSAAQAALTVSPFTLNTTTTGSIQCYARWGGTAWPDNGTSVNDARYIYCGSQIASLPANPTQAQLQALGTTALTSLANMPTHVKTLFSNNSYVVVIYKDFNQRWTGTTPPADGANFSAISDYMRSPLPPITRIYEQSQNFPYTAYEVAFNARHEAGHVYHALKVPGSYLANSSVYRQLAARDFLYMDLKNPNNNYRGTYQYWLKDYGTSSNPPFGYEELFAEEFALSPNLPGNTPQSAKAVDPIIRDNFKCSQAYVNAHYQRGQDPVKSDFDALNSTGDSDVYSRCVLPYKTATCSYVTSTQPYPYLQSETTFFVYCGSNPTLFQNRTGTNLVNLYTTPAWRQNFQYAGYALYVFQDSAQAVSILGSAVPTSAQGVGVLGFSQPQAIGNATGPFIAMFERVKQSNGSYVEHPNTNDLYNYDSGLYRETGRAVDRIAGSYGSSSAAFRARIDGDITRFNARNGCATSGTDSNLWGTKKSTICGNGAKKAPYDTMTNIQIVRQFAIADLAPAVQLPPNYSEFFPDTALSGNYSLIWAELVGYYRSSANDGNDFEALHSWLSTVYVCGKLYANGYYQNMTAPTASCP